MPNEALKTSELLTSFHLHRHTVHDYARILMKRRWAALLVFITLVATTALYSFTALPIYKATTQIMVDRQQPRFLETRDIPSYDIKSEEFYQTQYKLLESQALAKRVATKLDLRHDPVYAPIFKGLPKDGDALKTQQAEERLSKSIIKQVDVAPIRNSSLINVSFSSPDPQLAARTANALAQCYIEQSMDLRFAATQEAANWLNQKIGEARKKLEESETKLNQYKKEQNIVTLEDKETITSQKLEQLNKEFVGAQTRRLEAETRFKEVSQGHPIREVLTNPLIHVLKGEEAKIIAQISELTKKYGERHPRMIQLNNELAAARGKIGAEMAHVTQSIKNEYSMAQAQEANLKAAMEAIKGETQAMSERTIQYRVLLRDVETNRALYENMLKSLKETTAIENLPSTNIRIVYPASVPDRPDRPRKFRDLALATILGIVFGCAVALGLEHLDTTLKTPDEVEDWLEIPNLAIIPHLEFTSDNLEKADQEIVVHYGSHPLASEAYRSLRTSILYSTPGHAPQILLMTSSFPLEGKSLTAVNLAAAMVQAEPKVLLVDADLRRPALHQIFQLDQEPGLTNFLVGEIDDLPVIETQVPHLYLLPAGTTPPNPSELLGSERMRELLTRARQQFGRIILDSPPLMSVTDAVILATLAEGVLLVIKAESVPRKAAIEARNDLLEVQAPLLGAVLNDVPLERDGHYYNYYYRAYSYYGSGENGQRTRRQPPIPNHRMPGVRAWINNKINYVAERISRKPNS